MDHIIVGKMGDYIGEDNKAQSFTDIIVEKLACIADHKNACGQQIYRILLR